MQSLIDSISTYQTKYETSAHAFSQFSIQFHSYLKNTLTVVQKNNASAQSRNTSNSTLSFSAFNAEDSTSGDTLLALIDDTAMDPSNLIVKMNTMCIVYHHLFGNLDQKLFASIIESNTKVSVFMENLHKSKRTWSNGSFSSCLYINGNSMFFFHPHQTQAFDSFLH